jgi:hypothetical protein
MAMTHTKNITESLIIARYIYLALKLAEKEKKDQDYVHIQESMNIFTTRNSFYFMEMPLIDEAYRPINLNLF